ncbi:MAG: ATP-binding protein [Pseudomonadota bacterium]
MGSLFKLIRTTAFRQSVVYLAFFLLFGIGAIAYLTWQAEELLREQLQETVEADTAGLIDQYESGGIRGLTNALQRRSLQPDANLYLVTNFAGQPLAGNVRNVPGYVLAEERWVDTAYGSLNAGGAFDKTALIKVSILPSEFRLLVGRDLKQTEEVRRIIWRSSIWTMLGFGSLWLMVSLFVSRRVLQRVDAMAATSRTIMEGDMTERLPVAGTNDELDNLAISLNAMLHRIDQLMRGLKDVSDNIAHDLKTPITRLRNRAEDTLRTAKTPDEFRAALGQLTDEVDGIIRVFNALLLIARAEAGNLEQAFDSIDVAETARDVAELYEPSASDAGLDVVVEGARTARLRANRELIGQGAANLVENAIKYAGPSATRIVVSVVIAPDAVELVVSDDGRGIPDTSRDKAMERFERLGQADQGAGLGLSLVQAIAHLHGGELVLSDNAPGLRAALRIPRGAA